MRKMCAIVAAIVSAASMAKAETPHQFDLVCTGTITVRDTPQPYHQVYSIDLDQSVYATPHALAARPMVIRPNELILDAGPDLKVHLNRGTGQLRASDPEIDWRSDATCKIAPFSGLPSQMF